MQDRLENGLVVRVTGGDVWVRVGADVLVCSLRGRFRVKRASLQVVAGDQVSVRRDPGGSGVTLEDVLPRQSHLSRWVERGGGERAIVANVEHIFVVATLAEPPFRPVFVDRILAAAEYGHAPVGIVLNKVDLSEPAELNAFAATYRACGYEIYPTSATTGEGVAEVEKRIGDGVYAFVGLSGVGKTSLVNRLDPRLARTTREVAERSGHGRHTTTSSELYPFRTGFLADTPGMQTFGFPGRVEDGVARCFPEIDRVDTSCRFQSCTHTHEPGCAVKAAVDAGTIAASRYQSYVAIVDEVRAHMKEQAW